MRFHVSTVGEGSKFRLRGGEQVALLTPKPVTRTINSSWDLSVEPMLTSVSGVAGAQCRRVRELL